MSEAALPDPEKMEAAVHEYIAAFAAGSPERAAALYAADGTVEDPVGSPLIAGHDAILAFYTMAMDAGAKLKLEGPVRICGDYAAFAFSARMHWEGSGKHMDVIDTFRFNSANEVIEMRAYTSPYNRREIS